MSYQVQGTIEVYDPATDSCVCEMTGLGMLETWLTGLKPEAQVNRAFLRPGATCTLSFPDANRLCEGKIVAVTDASTGLVSTTVSAAQITQVGLIKVVADISGNGSTAVTFSPAFSSAPTVTTRTPTRGAATISAITTSGFTVTITGAGPLGLVLIPWSAVGNQ